MLDLCIFVIQSRQPEPREALKPWPVILKRPQTSGVTQFMKLRGGRPGKYTLCIGKTADEWVPMENAIICDKYADERKR